MADRRFQFIYLCLYGLYKFKAGFPTMGGPDYDVNRIGFPLWAIQTFYEQHAYQAQLSGFHSRRWGSLVLVLFTLNRISLT